MRHMFLKAFTLAAACGSVSYGDVDHLVRVVDTPLAAGTNSFSAFVYMPTTDTMYTATFGSGAALRRIDNVSGTQASTIVATEGDITLFYREGDPTRGVTTPVMSGMIYNPAQVGTIPAEGNIWITDAANTRLPNSSTTDPTVTKRVYRYNLGTIPPGGDGRDVLTSVATLADFQAAGGGGTGSPNISRMAAFSPNGQTLYAIDSSTAFGGVYKVNPLGGGVERILNVTSNGTGNTLINTEPGVLRVDGKDRIFFRGNQRSAADPDMNVGGINYIDYDGTTASAQQVFVAAADLRAFLELPVVPTNDVTDVRTITFGADGTMYFYDQETTRLLARDTEGRLFKVASRAERDLAFTGSTTTTPTPGASVLRLQTREVTHPTAGAITQLMYSEPTPMNFVAGVNVFAPTDFDRDGDQDAADLDLLEPVITARGIASDVANGRFDLNGNGVIDWKDVKIAQTFQPFANGDTDFSFSVDFDDLLKLAQNYGLGTDRTWLSGDFDGDNDVDFDDLLTLAQNYTVGGLTDTSAFTTSFAADWSLARSLVPEPTSLALVSLLSVGLGRRRK